MDSVGITDMEVVPCINSRFLVPTRVTYKQNDIQRTQDYIKAHDGVYVLIFNTTREAFVLVKQFRPSLYMNFNPKVKRNEHSLIEGKEEATISVPYEKGISHELCAGIVDAQKPLIEIVKSEILEETGYNVPVENIQRLFQQTDNSVGVTGIMEYVYYVEVSDDMKVADGGGLADEGEFIELFYLPLKDAKEYVFSDKFLKTAAELAAFCWYFWKHGL